MDSLTQYYVNELSMKCIQLLHNKATAKIQSPLSDELSEGGEELDTEKYIKADETIRNVLSDRWSRLVRNFKDSLDDTPENTQKENIRKYLLKIKIEVELALTRPLLCTILVNLEKYLHPRKEVHVQGSRCGRSCWLSILPFSLDLVGTKVLHITSEQLWATHLTALLKYRFGSYLSILNATETQHLNPSYCSTFDLVITSADVYKSNLLVNGLAPHFTHIFVDDVTVTRESYSITFHIQKLKENSYPHLCLITTGKKDVAGRKFCVDKTNFYTPRDRYFKLKDINYKDSNKEIIQLILRTHKRYPDKGGILVFVPNAGACHDIKETLLKSENSAELNVSIIHEYILDQTKPLTENCDFPKRKIILMHWNRHKIQCFYDIKYIIQTELSQDVAYSGSAKTLVLNPILCWSIYWKLITGFLNNKIGSAYYYTPTYQVEYPMDNDPFLNKHIHKNIFWHFLSQKYNICPNEMNCWIDDEALKDVVSQVKMNHCDRPFKKAIALMLLYVDIWSFQLIVKTLVNKNDVIIAAIQYSVLVTLPPLSLWNGYVKSYKVPRLSPHGDVFNAISLYRSWRKSPGSECFPGFNTMMEYTASVVHQLISILTQAGVPFLEDSQEPLSENTVKTLKVVLQTIHKVYDFYKIEPDAKWHTAFSEGKKYKVHPSSQCHYEKSKVTCEITSHLFVASYNAQKQSLAQITMFFDDEFMPHFDLKSDRETALQLTYNITLKCLGLLEARLKKQARDVCEALPYQDDLVKACDEVLQVTFNRIKRDFCESPIETVELFLRDSVPKLKSYSSMLVESPILFSQLLYFLEKLQDSNVIHIGTDKSLKDIKWLLYVLVEESSSGKVLMLMNSEAECQRFESYLNSKHGFRSNVRAKAECYRFGSHLDPFSVIITTPLSLLVEILDSRWLSWFSHILIDETSVDELIPSIAKLISKNTLLVPRMKIVRYQYVLRDEMLNPVIHVNSPITDPVVYNIPTPLITLPDSVVKVIKHIRQAKDKGGIQVFLPTPQDCHSCYTLVRQWDDLSATCDYEFSESSPKAYIDGDRKQRVVFVCYNNSYDPIYPEIKYVVYSSLLCDKFYDVRMGLNVLRLHQQYTLNSNEDTTPEPGFCTQTGVFRNRSIWNYKWQTHSFCFLLDALKRINKHAYCEPFTLSTVFGTVDVLALFGWTKRDDICTEKLRVLRFIDPILVPVVLKCLGDSDTLLLTAIRFCLVLMYPIRYWHRDWQDLEHLNRVDDVMDICHMYHDYVAGEKSEKHASDLPQTVCELFNNLLCMETECFKCLRGSNPPGLFEQSKHDLRLVADIYVTIFQSSIVTSIAPDHYCEIRHGIKCRSYMGNNYAKNIDLIGYWLLMIENDSFLTNVVILSKVMSDDFTKRGSELGEKSLFISSISMNPFIFQQYLMALKREDNWRQPPAIKEAADYKQSTINIYCSDDDNEGISENRDVIMRFVEVVDSQMSCHYQTVGFAGTRFVKSILTSGCKTKELLFTSVNEAAVEVNICSSFSDDVSTPYLILPNGYQLADSSSLLATYTDIIPASLRDCKVKMETIGPNNVLQLDGTDQQGQYALWHFLHKYLQGHLIPLTKQQIVLIDCDFATSNLSNIAKKTKTTISLCRNMSCLSVSGQKSQVQAATERVHSFLSMLVKQPKAEVDFDDVYSSERFIRTLILTYGPALEGLKKAYRCSLLKLDLNKKLLVAFGKKSYMNELQIGIDRIPDNYSSFNIAQSIIEMKEWCCFCGFDYLDPKMSYRLQLCGHSYCWECAQAIVDNCFNSKTLPIICLKQDCGKELSIYDIERLLSPGYDFSNMTQVSKILYMKENDKLVDCPNLFCPGVMEKAVMKCPVCHYKECKNCGLLSHQSFSCDTASSIIRDLEDVLSQCN